MTLFNDSELDEVPGLSTNKEDSSSLFAPEEPAFSGVEFGELGEDEPVMDDDQRTTTRAAPPKFEAPVSGSADFEDEDDIFPDSAPPPPTARSDMPKRAFAKKPEPLPETFGDEEFDPDFGEFSDEASDGYEAFDEDDVEIEPAPSNMVSKIISNGIYVVGAIFIAFALYFAYQFFFAQPDQAGSLHLRAQDVRSHADVSKVHASPAVLSHQNVTQVSPAEDSVAPSLMPMVSAGDKNSDAAVAVTEVPAEAAAAVGSPLIQRNVERPSSMISADLKAMSDRVSALEQSMSTGVSQEDLQKIVDEGKSREADYEAKIASLQSEVDGLKGSLKAAVEKASAAAIKARAAVVAVKTVQKEASKPVEPAPPMKPAVLNGFSLKGIARNAAWIDTGKGIVKASVGDKISGAGIMREIRKTGNGVIVVTSTGIIIP